MTGRFPLNTALGSFFFWNLAIFGSGTVTAGTTTVDVSWDCGTCALVGDDSISATFDFPTVTLSPGDDLFVTVTPDQTITFRSGSVPGNFFGLAIIRVLTSHPQL